MRTNNNDDLPWWVVLLIVFAALLTAKYLFHLDHMHFVTSWFGMKGMIKR